MKDKQKFSPWERSTFSITDVFINLCSIDSKNLMYVVSYAVRVIKYGNIFFKK